MRRGCSTIGEHHSRRCRDAFADFIL